MKSTLKLFLALSLVVSILFTATGCSGSGSSGEKNTNSTGSVKTLDYLNTDSPLPIVKKGNDITLKVMLVEGAYYQDMKDISKVYFVNSYGEKSNVKIEWIEVSKDAFDDKLALMLSTGDLPDVIMKSGISNSSQLKYGDQGYFLNLMDQDMLKNYAPNYWALCEKYPEIRSASMMPDGKVYSMGLVRNSVGSVVASKMYFNQDWLKKLNLSVPKTSQDLYDVLNAFKNKDPNGNGVADEIGLFTSPTHLENTTFGMFGIGNRGLNNGYIDCDPSTGKARYFPTTTAYRDWLQYVIKLYKEGLLNKEYFDFTESKLGSTVMNNTCGALSYTNLAMVSKGSQSKMTYLDGALTGPNGNKDWYGTSSVGSTGSYIITSKCKYPEVALKWADYFYSDEGALFYYYGDEGVTYEKNADGTYKYTDKVLADFNAGTNSFDGCSAYVSLYAYGNSPTKTQVPFNSADDNNGISLLSANKLIKDCAIAWPSFTFTRSEQRVIEDVKNDIDSYVKSSRDSWIMGTTALNDTTWNEFVQTINKMGIDQIIEVYNTALERVKKDGFKEGFHSEVEFK